LLGTLIERLIPVIYENVPIITVSNSVKTDLMTLGLLNNDINIVSSGIPKKDEIEVGFTKKDRNLVVYLGRLKKYKGVDILLDAIKLIKKAILKYA